MHFLIYLKKVHKSRPLLGFFVAILTLSAFLSITALHGIDRVLSDSTGFSAHVDYSYPFATSAHPKTGYNQHNLYSTNYNRKNLSPDYTDLSFQNEELTRTSGTFLSCIDFNNSLSPVNLKLTYLFSDIPPPSLITSL